MLRPAVEMIRGMPFEGTSYLWPDAEGITSNLVLLATSAAAELARHHLTLGQIDGVFWATGQGLRVLPGHEDLIALRMRAHASNGDLAGVRHEWQCYERVIAADPWSDGEPAPKLVELRHQLLSPNASPTPRSVCVRCPGRAYEADSSGVQPGCGRPRPAWRGDPRRS